MIFILFGCFSRGKGHCPSRLGRVIPGSFSPDGAGDIWNSFRISDEFFLRFEEFYFIYYEVFAFLFSHMLFWLWKFSFLMESWDCLGIFFTMSFKLTACGDQGSLFLLCVVLNRASRIGAAVEDLTVDEWWILIAACFYFWHKGQMIFFFFFNLRFVRCFL